MSSNNNPFSGKGRMSPRFYWPSILIALVVKYGLTMLELEKPEWNFIHSDFVLFFVAAIIGKRMQDFGVSARWAWLFVVLVSFALPILAIVAWPQPHDAAYPLDVLPPSISIITGVLLLGFIVIVGRRKGDPGPNRFGDAPS